MTSHKVDQLTRAKIWPWYAVRNELKSLRNMHLYLVIVDQIYLSTTSVHCPYPTLKFVLEKREIVVPSLPTRSSVPLVALGNTALVAWREGLMAEILKSLA